MTYWSLRRRSCPYLLFAKQMDYFHRALFLYLGLRDVVKRLVDTTGHILYALQHKQQRCEYCTNFHSNLIHVGMTLILPEGATSINFVSTAGNALCGHVMSLTLLVY